MLHHYYVMPSSVQRPAYFPGEYLRVSARPFVPQPGALTHAPSFSVQCFRGADSSPFPAPFSLPMSFRSRGTPLVLLQPQPLSPSPASLPKLSLEDLKLKSLTNLLPAVVAFLCTIKAVKTNETAAEAEAGFPVSDLSCHFNDTFGSQTALHESTLEAPFLFKEDVPSLIRLLNDIYAATESAGGKEGTVYAPRSFLKLKIKTNVAGKAETCFSTQVPTFLIGFIIGRKGESVKKIYTDTGVELLILQKDQLQPKWNCMVDVQLRFGNMPESSRLSAAEIVLKSLQQLFLKLYNTFPCKQETFLRL